MLLLLIRCVLNILNHLRFMEDVTVLLLLNVVTWDKVGRISSLYCLSCFSSLGNRLNHEISWLWSISYLVQRDRQRAAWIILPVLYRGTLFFVILYGIILIINLLLDRIFLDLLIHVHLWYLLEFLCLLKVNARVGYQRIFGIRFVTNLGYPLPVLLNLGILGLERRSFAYRPNMLVYCHLLFLAVTQQEFGAWRLSMVCLSIRRQRLVGRLLGILIRR